MHSLRATFLLIHGVWHGAWVWQKLLLMLEAAGHQAFAPDLPGAGLDRMPLSAITLASSVNRVLDLVDHVQEPVILVGQRATPGRMLARL